MIPASLSSGGLGAELNLLEATGSLLIEPMEVTLLVIFFAQGQKIATRLGYFCYYFCNGRGPHQSLSRHGEEM